PMAVQHRYRGECRRALGHSRLLAIGLGAVDRPPGPPAGLAPGLFVNGLGPGPGTGAGARGTLPVLVLPGRDRRHRGGYWHFFPRGFAGYRLWQRAGRWSLASDCGCTMDAATALSQ